jgi:hypothetical protein
MTRSDVVLALVLGAAVPAAAGCGGSSPSAPSTPVPLRVTVQVNPTLVGDPSAANFSIRAENISQDVLDLTFPSGCQILPHFVERASRRPVTPVGGGFACVTMITRATLRPGESIARTVLVKSGTTPDPQYVVLPPGDYAVYARLEDQSYRLESAQLPFTIR